MRKRGIIQGREWRRVRGVEERALGACEGGRKRREDVRGE